MKAASTFFNTFAYGAIAPIRNLVVGLLFVPATVYAETITIAALGDSLTAGYGLPQSDGFVPQLQAWLDQNGVDAKVLNAGVSGDTTAGGLSRADWTLTPDVDAMIVTLGGNDFLRGIDPLSSKANLSKILEKGEAAGVEMLIVGITVSSNYGPDYQTAFEGMYPALSEEFDVPYVPNFFAGMTNGRDMAEARATLLQTDGIHPNKEGVSLIVEALGPSVADLAERAASR